MERASRSSAWRHHQFVAGAQKGHDARQLHRPWRVEPVTFSERHDLASAALRCSIWSARAWSGSLTLA